VSAVNTLVSYVTEVSIGEPATTYDLIVDSGSANTWAGAGKKYAASKTTEPIGYEMNVTYRNSEARGEIVFDNIKIGDMTITGQIIGNATHTKGFNPGEDGILGIGPTELTRGTIVDQDDLDILTVTDNAEAQELIKSKVIGVYFEPATTYGEVSGEVTFGGYNSDRATSELNMISFTDTEPANKYVGIDQSITYGDAHAGILEPSAGIVDTGSSLVLLTPSAYDAYRSATGATYDSDTGMLYISADDYESLESLYFHIGEETYEFTKNAQIWPRSLNYAIGGTDDRVYLIIGQSERLEQQGLGFVNGQTFLERFFHIFNGDERVFGIATTEYTYAETN